MSELFSKLGIDWRLLVAQLANFLILLFVLRRFAYKPLLKLLEERKQRIADGLANAQKAKSNLEEAEKERQEIISTAKKEHRKLSVWRKPPLKKIAKKP